MSRMLTAKASVPSRPASTALRIVLFGMPDAGKSSLLGALQQAALAQEYLLGGRLIDLSNGLLELEKRLYEGQPRQTSEEIVAYPVRFEPIAGLPASTDRLDALLIDCDGRVANDLLARRRTLHGRPASASLAASIIRADTLVLVVDAAASSSQLVSDFSQFEQFLRLFEHYRGDRTEVSGLPVYFVLTKCDLLSRPSELPAQWLETIEERKTQIAHRFEDFLARRRGQTHPPFGKIALHAWATAVKRPELLDAPARPRDPYGVAELFRQCLNSAREFREQRARSNRVLRKTVFGSLAVLALMVFAAVFLYVGRSGSEPTQLEAELDQYRSQELSLTSTALYRNPQARLDELSRLAEDPGFARLPTKKQEYVRERLRALHAYLEYDRQLQEAPDPRDARTPAQLDQIQKLLGQIAVPTEYRAEWSQTEAGRQHADWIEDVQALRLAVARVEGWYRQWAATGKQVLDKADEPNLPARAKKILQEAADTPFPEDKEKLIPGSKRLTYATVFAFDSVAEARRRWEEIHKRLEPPAKLG